MAYLISRIIILVGATTAEKQMMLLFAFVALILTLATVICAIICIMNFDKGFKGINESKNDDAYESYRLQPVSHIDDQTLYPSRPHPAFSPSRLTLE